MYRPVPKTMNIYGVFKFIVGFFLAILILAGATVATALYFAARLAELPERPTFPNDNPKAKVASKATTPKPQVTPTPTPTPAEEKLEPGAYRAIVTQPIGLILRDSPSTDANRIGGIAYNEKVVVLGESDDKGWQKVRVSQDSDRTGWVKGGNTEKVESEN
jgi:uncharacterized protein YgiM (DUF1202 family)